MRLDFVRHLFRRECRFSFAFLLFFVNICSLCYASSMVVVASPPPVPDMAAPAIISPEAPIYETTPRNRIKSTQQLMDEGEIAYTGYLYLVNKYGFDAADQMLSPNYLFINRYFDKNETFVDLEIDYGMLQSAVNSRYAKKCEEFNKPGIYVEMYDDNPYGHSEMAIQAEDGTRARFHMRVDTRYYTGKEKSFTSRVLRVGPLHDGEYADTPNISLSYTEHDGRRLQSNGAVQRSLYFFNFPPNFHIKSIDEIWTLVRPAVEEFNCLPEEAFMYPSDRERRYSCHRPILTILRELGLAPPELPQNRTYSIIEETHTPMRDDTSMMNDEP